MARILTSEATGKETWLLIVKGASGESRADYLGPLTGKETKDAAMHEVRRLYRKREATDFEYHPVFAHGARWAIVIVRGAK